MSVFGDVEGTDKRKGAGILFRLEYLPGQVPSYLIRSSIRPERLPNGSQMVEENGRIPEKGTAVIFRLAVNAVQRTKSGIRPVFIDGGIDEARENGLLSEGDAERAQEITPWLNAKLSPGLTDVHILNHQREVVGRDRHGRNTSKQDNKVVQVDLIDGVAMVSDPEALQTLLIDGVGRAKSYGCGLLTVRQA